MRDFEQRKEEIFARGKEKIARRKKITKRVVMTCVPVCLCVCIAGGWLALGGFGMSDKAASEANMAMDSVAYGDTIYGGAEVPMENGKPAAPEANAPAVISLELSRDGRSFYYTEPEIVDMFLKILEGESTEIPDAQVPDDIGEFIANFNPDPGKLIEDKPYPVKLTHPDGREAWFILRGTQLTSQDGLQYTLTREEASILHKLMEIDWEGKTGEARPWYEEEIIEKAAEQITWNYYVATAVQNAETGEWTVTFWSRSRMDSQVVIVDRYGGVLEVKAGTFLSESE